MSAAWKLATANRKAAATRGDNDGDNVKQVLLTSPAAGTYTVRVKLDTATGTIIRRAERLMPGDTGFVTTADVPITAEDESAAPQYRLVTGAYQPFSLIMDGNQPSSADDFRITSFIKGSLSHTITWQSVKGLAYLIERSADLATWDTLTAALTWYTPVPGGTPPALLVASATGSTHTLGNIPAGTPGTRYFYRVRVAGMP